MSEAVALDRLRELDATRPDGSNAENAKRWADKVANALRLGGDVVARQSTDFDQIAWENRSAKLAAILDDRAGSDFAAQLEKRLEALGKAASILESAIDAIELHRRADDPPAVRSLRELVANTPDFVDREEWQAWRLDARSAIEHLGEPFHRELEDLEAIEWEPGQGEGVLFPPGHDASLQRDLGVEARQRAHEDSVGILKATLRKIEMIHDTPPSAVSQADAATTAQLARSVKGAKPIVADEEATIVSDIASPSEKNPSTTRPSTDIPASSKTQVSPVGRRGSPNATEVRTGAPTRPNGKVASKSRGRDVQSDSDSRSGRTRSPASYNQLAVRTAAAVMVVGVILYAFPALRTAGLWIGGAGMLTFLTFIAFNPDHMLKRLLGAIVVTVVTANIASVAVSASEQNGDSVNTKTLETDFGAGAGFNVTAVVLAVLVVAAMVVEAWEKKATASPN